MLMQSKADAIKGRCNPMQLQSKAAAIKGICNQKQMQSRQMQSAANAIKG